MVDSDYVIYGNFKSSTYKNVNTSWLTLKGGA